MRAFVSVQRMEPPLKNPPFRMPFLPDPPATPDELLKFGFWIDRWTRQSLGESEPWVASVGPAVHAFFVMQQDDGLAWRLDAVHPCSTWSPCATKPYPGEARWEIMMPEPIIRNACVHIRNELTGRKYDWGEVLGQAKMLIPFLPIPFGPEGASKLARLCTNLTLDALQRFEGAPATFAAGYPANRSPELFGRLLERLGAASWAKRVI